MNNNIFLKIELLLLDKNNSINKLTFENCELQFIGSFMIICEIDENNIKLCQIFDLTKVKSYKVHQNK